MTGDTIQKDSSMTKDWNKSLKSNSIQIRIINSSDHDRVLYFLRTHYYQEEPLTIGCEPKEQDPEDEKFNMSQIVHGTCLMAMSEEQIIGVLISGPKTSNEAEHLFEDAARFGSTKWGAALQILGCAERDSNVYEAYNVSKALHIHILAVDAKLRGRAIGASLIEELKIISRQLGYPLLTLDSTSYYSAKLDKEGHPVFKPPPPHEYLKTFAMKL